MIWLGVFVPALLAGLVLCGICTRGILRTVGAERQAPVASLTPLPEQRVVLDAQGSIGAYALTRLPSAEFARTTLSLVSEGDGGTVPGRRSWMRENDRALGPARRVKLDVFDVPAAGAYTLRAEGLPERAIASETELLLAPAPSDTQSMGALVPYILGTVGGALLSMGALLSTLFTLYRS